MRGTAQGALRAEVRVLTHDGEDSGGFLAELASKLKAYVTSYKNKTLECLRQKEAVNANVQGKKEPTAIQCAWVERAWGSSGDR